MPRVTYADGRTRPSPPPARTWKEAEAALRQAFDRLRGGPPSSFKQMRELTERHRSGADIRWPKRRPAWRPAARRARPTSSPPPAHAPDVAVGGRDGNNERDDGSGGDSDGDGGGSSEPPGPRSHAPFAGGVR